MLGPLPRLYRSLVVAAVLLVGVVSGLWFAHSSARPLAAVAGAVLGAGAALLVAFLLVHDFSGRPPSARVAHRP